MVVQVVSKPRDTLDSEHRQGGDRDRKDDQVDLDAQPVEGAGDGTIISGQATMNCRTSTANPTA